MNLIKYLKDAQYPYTGTPTVAFFGDSVTHGAFECIQGDTAGCNFDFEAVYHNRFRRALTAVNPWLPVSIINAGVAGDCARTALSRLEQEVIARHPDLCVVNFCLNDVNDPLDVYTDSLSKIFDALHTARIPAVLLTCNMLNTYVHPDTIPMYRDYAAVTANYQTSGRMDAFVEAARQVAESHGVTVADAYAKWKRMAADGIDTTACLANYINHPSREMHALFCDALMEVIDWDIRA